MHLSRMTKRIITGASSLFLSACTAPQPTVYCHDWTLAEKGQIAVAVTALPHDHPLRWVDKDYQRVCINLKP